MAIATFGAGCFWGVEAIFRNVPGVTNAAVGYLGGSIDNPTYEVVCSGTSGHAEVVQVTFDESTVSFETLLATFWACHNPTTLNRQGPDIGTQYRSAIFYHTEEQKTVAELSKHALDVSGKFEGNVVTEISATSTFYRAEEYHQRYLEKHGRDHCGI